MLCLYTVQYTLEKLGFYGSIVYSNIVVNYGKVRGVHILQEK